MSELRDDLQRFLGHQPVTARPPTWLRRVSKWSQRHPTAATALALSCSASVALAVLFARSERLRRDLSAANVSLVRAAEDLRLEAAVSEEVVVFLIGMFDKADPDVSGDRVPSVRELIGAAIERLHGGEVRDPQVRARLLGALGSVSAKVGDWRLGETLLADSLRTWDELGDPTAPEATQARLALAAAFVVAGKVAEGEQVLQPLLDRLESDAAFREEFGVRTLVSLAELRTHAGRLEEGEAALDRAAPWCADSPPSDTAWLRFQDARATNYLRRGRLEDARRAYERILDGNPELVARADPRMLVAMNGLGLVLYDLGDFDESEEVFLDVIEQSERSLDPDHPGLLTAKNNLARVWEATERYEDAEAIYSEILDAIRPQLHAGHSTVLRFKNNLGTCLVKQGRVEEAERLHREVWTARRELYPEDETTLLNCQNNLAFDLYRLARYDEALELQEEVVARTAADHPQAAGRRALLDSIRTALARR
jgi:tetratricopeptide (TPR) repeat protein